MLLRLHFSTNYLWIHSGSITHLVVMVWRGQASLHILGNSTDPFPGSGFSHPGISVTAVVLGTEMMGPKFRSVAAISTVVCTAIGQVPSI